MTKIKWIFIILGLYHWLLLRFIFSIFKDLSFVNFVKSEIFKSLGSHQDILESHTRVRAWGHKTWLLKYDKKLSGEIYTGMGRKAKMPKKTVRASAGIKVTVTCLLRVLSSKETSGRSHLVLTTSDPHKADISSIPILKTRRLKLGVNGILISTGRALPGPWSEPLYCMSALKI